MGNPFINPHDPTHRDFRFNTNGANFAPQSSAPASAQNFGVPPCADCAGVNPFVNPFDASHQQAGLLAGHQAGFRAAAPRPQPVRQSAPIQPAQPAFHQLQDSSLQATSSSTDSRPDSTLTFPPS